MEMHRYITDSLLRVEEMSEVKTEKERVDGKKSREYYTLMFSDAANPLINWRTRNFFQHHSPDGSQAYWRGANPTNAKAMIGATVKGEIMKVPVETYTIVDGTGVSREVDNFTIVIFNGETIEEVVRSYGHIHAQQLGSIGSSRTDVGHMPSTKEQLAQSKINSQAVRITDQPNAQRPAGGYDETNVQGKKETPLQTKEEQDKEKKPNPPAK